MRLGDNRAFKKIRRKAMKKIRKTRDLELIATAEMSFADMENQYFYGLTDKDVYDGFRNAVIMMKYIASVI